LIVIKNCFEKNQNSFFIIAKNNVFLQQIKTTKTMVYNFLLLSDEDEVFLREISIDSDDTFLDLHNAIVAAAKFEDNQMASFFICNDEWEKEQEITLVEMDTTSEYDNLTMEDTVLGDLISDEGQKLLYVFDYMSERAFFIRLKEILVGKNLDKAVCTRSEGKAPEQMIIDEDFVNVIKNDNFDENFYGDEEFDLDELDEESFSDMNFEDNNFEL
jgi:hypothetical protein